MLRFALVALVATSACRLSLDDGSGPPPGPDGGGPACTVSTANPECLQAADMPAVSQTLSWIETNVFSKNCATTSCHGMTGGGVPGGGVVLTTASHDKLVNVDAKLAAGRKLVVAGNPKQSYLLVLMRQLALGEAEPPAPAPRDNLYMPLSSPPVCCQKLDAIERWIMAGAMNN